VARGRISERWMDEEGTGRREEEETTEAEREEKERRRVATRAVRWWRTRACIEKEWRVG